MMANIEDTIPVGGVVNLVTNAIEAMASVATGPGS